MLKTLSANSYISESSYLIIIWYLAKFNKDQVATLVIGEEIETWSNYDSLENQRSRYYYVPNLHSGNKMLVHPV